MGRLVYVRNKKTKPSPDGRRDGTWSDKKRLEAVTTFLATGNLSLTSRIINVPRDTVKIWTKQSWWKERINELKDEETIQLDKKLAKIVEKSLDAVNDRIENGDYQYDSKTGKLVRVPARLRDIHNVSKDLIDRRTIIQKINNQKQEQQVQTTNEDRLLKLAETFATLALGKKAQEEKVVNQVYDGDYENLPEEINNAIHEKREPGLQTGTELGTQVETESCEGSCPEECCEVQSG